MSPVDRIGIARKYLAGARALREAGDHAGAISRCYYSAYQGMWAALADPPRKPRWEHMGLMAAFVRGRWDDPAFPLVGPGLHEQMRFPLRRLYALRIAVDYHGEAVTEEIADWAMGVAEDVIETVSARMR